MNHEKTLPLEVIVTISEFLAGSNAFRTLASLNLASQLVKEATLPVLYHTVIWEDGNDHWSYSDLAVVNGTSVSRYFPPGWRYTRILFVDAVTNQRLNQFAAQVDPDLTCLALFPHLQIHVTKEYGEEPDAWPIPLRTCVVDVYQPVSAKVFATIQEYPLWWPEHQQDCEHYPRSSGDGIAGPSFGNTVDPSMIDLLLSSDNAIGGLWATMGSNGTRSSRAASKREEVPDRNNSYTRCACLRLPADHIEEITFMEHGFLLQSPRTGRLPSMIRQVHTDVRIFAAWAAEDDRIQETFYSLFRLFECLNYCDIDGERNVCNVIFCGSTIALVPFTYALPKLLVSNSDLCIVLQFLDRPTLSNASFIEIMQRVFNSYMVKLSHINACRSADRILKTLFAIEFPVIKELQRYQVELGSEIRWYHEGKSLSLTATACRAPSFNKEVIADEIGLQIWPRIPSPELPSLDLQAEDYIASLFGQYT